MLIFIQLLICAYLSKVSSMPYNVPLQGVVSGKRTLVLLDNMAKMQSHSLFFEQLSNRGHDLSFVQAESPDLLLKKFGEYLHDNIIIFAPTIEEFNTITPEDILEFTNNGGNLLMAVDSQISETMRSFAESCGIEFDSKDAVVIDHFQNHPSATNSLQHDAVLASNHVKSAVVLGAFTDARSNKPVLYRGIGHAVDDGNILAIKILRGNPSTYSANPNKPIDDYPENAGADTLLVTALQARNNARVVVTGSLDMFSNSYFRTKLPNSNDLVGNEVFCSELSKWAFGEAGVLRFRDITHHKVDGSPPDVILHEKERPDLPLSLFPDPELTRNSLVYRIKDNIVYSMVVEQLAPDGSWAPFAADDMQMEFVMMDPYVRMTMAADPATGKFVANFIAPDSYGVFKFRVLYRRTGYSVLHAETQVSIRPFKHDEYERFIASAYPYYASAFSAMIGFFVFSVFFIFSNDPKESSKKRE